jgi:hypothetical protein
MAQSYLVTLVLVHEKIVTEWNRALDRQCSSTTILSDTADLPVNGNTR